MRSKGKTTQKLESVQLQHWTRAVRDGTEPVEKDPISGQIVTLSLPLARSDGDGLTFTLSRSGTASWVLRYRYAGRARELTIGNYPDIGLADARRIAREKRAEIDRGGDPAADKRRATVLAKQDWTIRQLVEDYREKVLKDLGLSTQRSYSRNLKRIEARLAAMPISKIGPLDIVALIEASGTKWTEANMLLCTARMLFRHATGKRLVPINPCVGIELNAILGKRPVIRRRLMLTEDELGLVMSGQMSIENRLAIKILLGTAVRSDELRNARWEQLDLKEGIWTVPSTKTGPGMQIPLSSPVMSWFKELKLKSAGSAYVLPTRDNGRRMRNGGDAPINPNTIGAAIDYWLEEHKPKVRRFTPHDLRSTAKSHMRALGIPRDITEMCLNHKLPGVEGIYDVHTYFEERRAALQAWGEFLVKAEVGPACIQKSAS